MKLLPTPVIVVGLVAAAGLLVLRLPFDRVASSSPDGPTATARDVALTGMAAGLRAIELNGAEAPRSFGQRVPGGGQFDVAISQNHYADFDIYARGSAARERHEITSNVIFEAPVSSALQLYTPVVHFDTAGTYLISGRNLRMPSVATGAGILPSVAGVATTSTLVKAEIDSVVTAESIQGHHGDGSTILTGYDGRYDEVYRQAVSTRGILEPVGPHAGSYGSVDDPAIVRIGGDMTTVGTFTGCGILIVENGSITAGAGFHWEGIILVRRSEPVPLTVRMTDNATVYGSMIVYDTGLSMPAEPEPPISFSMSGSARIRYSAEAIAKLGSRIPAIEEISEARVVSSRDVELTPASHTRAVHLAGS